jgi:hypothetical protein
MNEGYDTAFIVSLAGNGKRRKILIPPILNRLHSKGNDGRVMTIVKDVRTVGEIGCIGSRILDD